MMNKNYLASSAGFTLLEIMIVVVILGILAALVMPKIMARPEQARKVKMQQDILAIQSALDLYKLDNAIFPTNEQGLDALVKKPTVEPIPSDWKEGGYLSRLPIDPWGKLYQYINENDVVQVSSKGASNEK